MKFSALANASFILLSLVGPVSASSRCLRRRRSGHISHRITVEDVGSENIETVCKSLWDNLKRHPACMVFRPNGCEEAAYKGDLSWHFTTALACNAGMVHSAFYEATNNRWGAIRCQ
ncbi:hypothetical protein CGRA01v4_04551 [Colletotrichum graminicola]|uniref:Uncharacterized protein n=1 Tax=Colletotrichum graminicola (strain M1.001 / M2 / FGSC 10212) TaxID=645133 RepID=E3Q8U7_COLGM|nr:uncharacterized protein GLRG_01956 [Colletotrichum graminicola M1.001]EFQ27461.1 hypothetical protein GLRG_01956 [Colletotrichum graminicola M1.001]WDK13270.1 hypothetical protein CGRA01v4_04551 [Colletotrichum graminicola]